LTLGSTPTRELRPGQYGTIVVRASDRASGGVLVLQGGIYELESLELGPHSRLQCQARCEIRIEESLRAAQGSFIGPQPESSLTPRDVQLFVGGLDDRREKPGTSSAAAEIAEGSVVEARTYIPNGTLSLGRGVRVTGRLVARDVIVGSGGSIAVDSDDRTEEERSVAAGDRLSLEARLIQAADGQIRAFRPNPGVNLTAEELFRRYASSLGLGMYDVMSELDDRPGSDDRISRRFQQRHRGVPIFGAEVVVQEQRGRVVSVVGRFASSPDVPLNPRLTEADALRRALDAVPAERYAWEQASDSRSASLALPRGRLGIVSRDDSMAAATFRLAYRFEIATLRPFGGATIDIDADTGDELSRSGYLAFAPAPGNGDTLYDGKQPFITESFLLPNGSSSFRLRVPAETALPPLTTLYQGQPGQPEEDFLDSDNDFETWPADHLDAAKDVGPLIHGVSVHWAMQRVLAYLQSSVFNWKGFDGIGAKAARAVVLSKEAAGEDDNVFYHRSSATAYFPQTSKAKDHVDLVTVAHEVGHALLDHACPGLQYANETGALWEAFAEILGHLVLLREKGTTPWMYALPPRTIYYADQLGNGSCDGSTALCPGEQCDHLTEQCWQTVPGKSLGWSAADPKQNQDPDTYLGEYYVPKSGWCYKAGLCSKNAMVAVHWFYILINGESGTNDPRPSSPFGDEYAVKGIALDKAEKLIALTFKYKFTSHAGYKDIRAASIDTAIDEFGPESPEVVAVTDAWYAVGVGPKYTPRTYSPAGLSGVDPWPAYLKWRALPGEFEWQAQVSSDPTFQTDVKTVEPTQALVQAGVMSMLARVDLRPETKHYWRVRAKVDPEPDQPSAPDSAAPKAELNPFMPWIGPSKKKRVFPKASGPTMALPEVVPVPPQATWEKWGAGQEFSTAAKVPKPVAPAPSFVGMMKGSAPTLMPPTIHPWKGRFLWEAVAGATEYRLTVSSSTKHQCDKTKLSSTIEHTVVEFVAAGPPKASVGHEVALKSGRKYHWWLMVFGPQGIPGGCAWDGAPIPFDTASPQTVLLSPPDGEHVSPFAVPLGWDAVPGAAGYGLQIAEETSSFSGGEEVAGSSTTIQVTKEGTFHWRVQPRGPLAGDVGSFSQPRSFVADLTLTKPQLMFHVGEDWVTYGSPATGFKWLEIPGASTYRLTVFPRKVDQSLGSVAKEVDSGFQSCTNGPGGPGLCSTLSGLSTNQFGYCWKVAAIGTGGLTGPESDPGCYRISAASPQLQAPPSNATNVEYAPTTFGWKSDYAPGGYKLFVQATNGDCEWLAGTAVSLSAGTQQYSVQLTPNQRYCWTVVALNSDGSNGSMAMDSFTTKPPPAPTCTVFGTQSITWIWPPGNLNVTRPVVLHWGVNDSSIAEYRVFGQDVNFAANTAVPVLDTEVQASEITAGGEAHFMLPINLTAGWLRIYISARASNKCPWSSIAGVEGLHIQ